MQGKFVWSQSPSTLLSRKRFSMFVTSKASAFEPERLLEARDALNREAVSKRAAPRVRYSTASLFRKREIRFAPTRHRNGLGLRLRAFVPDHKRVGPIRNVLDLVVAVVIRLGEVGGRTDNNVSSHLRVHIAEKRHNAGLVEGE